ncbi:DUF4336 domain-containing protein [Bowmanella dokdonensis]|uniref:DUF4336 domain-containing protein n=1 Tax=Bowmanella dokdonensis TaxID=751969 RepID=A0A939IM82_9ALTE|nr:DUF4336 domain-containing protein [Bowmanella dokdonensis]MBN7825028.1 DUF4336 domain-containing protein [Bowmanella dokdonensis]
MDSPPLKALARDLWIHDGPAVPFYGLPYSTRMTVVRLKDGSLWIHSPAQLSDSLTTAIDALGPICHLIAPNKLHHLSLADWQRRYPQAGAYGAPGLAEKRPDLAFDGILTDSPPSAWQGQIDQHIFKGSAVMMEAVFFHPPSRTLILTDLVENFPRDYFHGWRRWAARLSGILAPNGRTPLDWRLSFLFNKSQARQSLQQLYDWRPERILLAHGQWIEKDAMAFLRRSFSWLD